VKFQSYNLSEIFEGLLSQGVCRVEEVQILGSIWRITSRSACRSLIEDSSCGQSLGGIESSKLSKRSSRGLVP
jgi:hypothetical protein